MVHLYQEYVNWVIITLPYTQFNISNILLKFIYCGYNSTCRPVLGPVRPHVQWLHGAHFPAVMRPEHEVDYSSPSSDRVMNPLKCTFTLQQDFMVWFFSTGIISYFTIYIFFTKLRNTDFATHKSFFSRFVKVARHAFQEHVKVVKL
jgi:hypothetical protein